MTRMVQIDWVDNEGAFYFGLVRLEGHKHAELVEEVQHLLGGQAVRAAFGFRTQ